MAASPWVWEEDGIMDIQTQPVSLTYCSNLNCIILTRTDNTIDIIDVNSGDIVRKTLVLDENNCNNLQCMFNPVAGNLVVTDGTCIGVRKDLNGIYLLKTALQTPVENARDGEIVIEMTLSDMEHVLSGLQTCMKDAHEPHLSKMERLKSKMSESIEQVRSKIYEGDEKVQKWASCHIKVDTDLIHSTLNHMVSLLHNSTSKGPPLSSTSALLSQVTSLLPASSTDQNDAVSNKRKMWSEVNRRKTFNNWPHKDYKWAVPDTMAQAGFYHQSDRRTYPNSVDRAVCFTCNVGLVCWEPTDEPWSEHERHSPKCPFVRGECTENVPLSVTIATSPAQFHNEEKQRISCVSSPTSVPLMATSTAEGQIVVWDIRDELQVRTRLRLKLDDKILSNDIGELDDLLTADVMSDVIEESTKETLDVEPENGGLGSSGKASGASSSKPDKSTTTKDDMSEPPKSNWEESTGVPITLTSVGILRNNQERENEAETPVFQTVLPEAMLITCVDTSLDISQPARPHLLVCEIPADKNRSGTPLKLPKSDGNKGKSKSVSYSTQLSFESEDEYYDPLFSVPSVFQSINSPLKDVGFSKSGAEKVDETQVVKDAKVVQCLGIDEIGSDNLEVSQVIPYEDGGHILFVLIRRKENCDQETCTDSHCPSKDNISKTENISASLGNCDNCDNNASSSALPTSSDGSVSEPSTKKPTAGTMNGTPFHAEENIYNKESYTDLNNSSSSVRPDSELSNEETNGDKNTKYPVETEVEVATRNSAGSSERVTEELKYSDNTKYAKETSDPAGSGTSVGADAMSNVDLLKCTENSSEDDRSDNIKYQGTSTESILSSEGSSQSDTEPIKSQAITSSAPHLLNSEHSIDENISSSEPKDSPTENTISAVFERNYSVCLLLYKTRKDKGRTLLEDKPCKSLFTTSTEDSLRDMFLLPDDAEDSFMPTSVEVNDVKKVYLAGISADGSLAVLDGLTLETVTRFSPDNSKPGQHIQRAIFCSGLGSFCTCTEGGRLHFLHLVKKSKLAEELASASASQASGVEKQANEPTSSIPLEDLSLKTLKSLVEMTTFENLVPRYTAIVPIFWSEIQQEQQQRRHPQHLLQNSQGDASCHTRTWRLQKKGLVGGDQLFKLMLPRPSYVGHVDITFTINKSAASKNNLQVILLKPRNSSLRPKPAQAFTLSGAQPTNDDVICGPIDLTRNLMPYGDKGHVVLTSASLLKTKVRSLHVVFKSQVKTSGKGEESSGGRNGFSDLEEISITVRSLNAHFNPDLFAVLLDTRSFCPRLMDIVCEEPNSDVSGQEREDLQWFALELLCWIAGVSLHQPVSKESLASEVVERLPMFIESCLLSSSRSIAHKCSRLVVLCISQLSSSDHNSEAKSCVLKAFLELLPSTLSSESSGGIYWFFTLLTGMLTADDVDGAGRSCMELLMNIAQRLDSKLTYHDRVLRTSFSLYGTPLDPTIFDVSMETMGLFATSKLSDDLLNPKNIGKHSQEVDEIDLMDYIIAKNSSRTLGTSSKMEQLLSSMYGILEVEPLDFSCSSMSDGCKIDYCQGSGPQGGGSNGIGSLYYPSTGVDIPTPMSALQDHVQQLKEHEKLLSKLQKQKQQLEEQHQELEELGGMLFSPMNAAQKHSMYEEAWGKDMSSPHQYKFHAAFGGMKTVGLFGGKAPSQAASMKTNTSPVPQTRTSFQLPVPKLLTIEKLQTGARHFVVLDFGQSVRLTDIFIPTCLDLSSLVIDIWVDGEEKDLSRITVSTDIGSKPLLLTDLLPPLTCRYLKISIFARHGTLRTKLILGEYFGYPVLSETAVTEAQPKENEDASREAYLNLMYDDVFCQYGIACSRLESVLNSAEPGTLMSSANDKSRKDETKVKQAYEVCMSLQLRLNFLEQSIQRINRRQSGNQTFPRLSAGENVDTVIEHASYSKLKVISDWLVHVLVSLFGVEAPTDNSRMQWTQDITFETCQSLFTTFCVKGCSVSRARVGAVLLRTCGEQAWWGEFLAWVMERFFSLEQTLMFSQERLFLLLTSMSQLSPVQYPVISSAVSLLEKLLSPILDVIQEDKGLHHSLDSRLLEWVTLYVSNLLDNFMDRSQDVGSKPKDQQGYESSDAKTANEHHNTSRRWDFIVPRTANDALNDSLKDSCKGLKGSKKEMRKLKKQIATRQRRLYAIHQHVSNKMQHSYEDYGPTSSPPSPFQITQWSKQFRQKAKKPLKDLMRLKRLITSNPSEPAVDMPYPSRNQKLPRRLCLPVMKGLLAVLLSSQGACSVDFFVLICKVLGCLTLVSQPRVSLNELASGEQLEQLLKMCVMSEGVPSSNWSSGDQWIRHASTTLLQDLVSVNADLRPLPVSKPPPLKPKPEAAETPDIIKTATEWPAETSEIIDTPTTVAEPAETSEIIDTPTTVAEPAETSEIIAADISIGDIPETDEPSDDSFADFGMFHDLFGDLSIGSEISEPKVSENTDPQIMEIIVAKPKLTPKTKDTKESPVVFSTLIVPVLTTAEISTAEDCRLEISLEMKAEQELRRLAFTSRQRFLTGMDLKSGVEFPGIAVAGFPGSGIESSGGDSSSGESSGVRSFGVRSSGAQSSEGQSSSGQSSEGQSSECQNSDVENSKGQSSGVQNSKGQSSEVGNSGVKNSLVGLQNSDTPYLDNEEKEHGSTKTYHFVSQCIGKLIVDSFKGCYEVESVMELCLLLNDDSSQSFLVIQQAMEASLEGLSTVEGKSARYWNLAISWLRMLLRQTRYVSVSGDSNTDYVTATNLVGNSCFPRVIGKMLTTCDMGDSGQRVLGPSLVKNFKLLLNELLAMTSVEHHGIDTSKFQEVLLDTLLYMTVQSDSQLHSSRSYPLDVCMAFLEFLTQNFPTNTPFSELSKPVKVVDSIMSLMLSYLSSSNQVCSVANSSKKKFIALFPTPGSSQDSSDDPSREKFLLLCLTFLPKLFPLNTGQSKLSDNLVAENSTMEKLLECLNMCRGESFELLEIGVNIVSGDLSEVQGLEKPSSIEDGVMKIFCLLYKHTQQRDTIVRSLLKFFSSDVQGGKTQQDSYYHISELLLWILLKLLDCDVNFQIFCENGGIDVICSKLSRATSRALHPVRGVVSTVVHQLGVKIHSKIEGEKHLLAAALESDKPLVNFAPYGTIHCPSHSASSVADNLISTTGPTRRARSAAWIHHFDHKDTWCPLYINLPNTVIVHEVVIQPHSASLSNSTSYVVIELCDESSSVTKISPPLLTAGLSNIRLHLTTPQLASAVRLRFHRPRDSDTLGLNRIEILGTSFYGPLPAIQPVLHSQKASLNWSRALDYCLRRSHSLSSLVLETLSNTEGILNVLLKILWTFPSSNLKSCVEFILIKFASSSTHVCTCLLNHLLYGGADLAGSLGVSHSGNSENELLYQLGIIQDDQTWERLKPLCEWLLYAEGQANMERPQSGNAGSNLIPKIRTTASVVWLIKDDPVLCDHLQALITEAKFRRIYEWSQRVQDIPMLKLTLDHLICALCYVIRPYFQCLLNLIGPSMLIDQSEGKTNYSALTTLARASHSSPGAKDLLESTILQKVVENVEKSCRKFMKGSKKVSSSTQLSDKSSPNSLEALEKLLEFLTLCLGHHQLKDWLGSEEGSSFWRSLLSFLTDCHSRVSTRDPSRVSTRDTSLVYVCPRVLASLQTTSLRYFKTCVSGHVRNQQNLARVLFELLARESDDVKPKTLSGFLRRLVLELLLDDDHMTLAVTCSNVTSQSVVTSPGNASQSPLWHPRFGTSNSCKLVSVRTNTKGQEILDTMVVNPLQQLQSLSSGVNDTAQKTSETLQDLAELFEFGDLSKHEAFTLTSSAFSVKHKRDKKKEEGTSNEGTGVNNPNPDVKLPIENWLCCKDGPLAEIPLPKDITVSQIMQTVVEHGQGMGTTCLRLDIRSPMDRNTSIPSEKSCDMISQKSVSTLLEVFSELGGLALIANHLPPRFSLGTSSDSNRTATSLYNPVVVTSLVPGHSLMGFTMFLRLPGYASILLENQQNACYMLRLILGVDDSGDGGYNPALASSQTLPTLPFTILQRLLTLHPVATTTGASIRQTALDTGVVHLLLTCLGLLSHHKPRNTDTRHESTMEALKAFNANNELGQAQSSGRTSSKQYWAKGTGFGTGSTSSGWDIEQALVKQKNEEEHITSILQVLASFICPLGVKIKDEVSIDDISLDISDEDITNALPSLPDIFMNSCLIPTLASYLRNDSVLDMARHVPLYRAVLGFVRCIAVSRNLVPLLHPGQHNTKNTSKDDTSSICSLLTKMKLCVDTYGSRLRSSEKVEDSKKKIKVETSPSSAATKTEDLENESLSLLIPDVQTTSMLVHKAVDRYRWEHLKIDGSSTDGDAHGQGADEELLSTEERYSSVMMPLQFDTFSVVTEGADGKINFTIPYHFSSSVKSATSSGQRTNAGRARRLAQEIASLSTSLPLSYSSSVFVRCDEERLDIMKVLMTGPSDTPYANGCFEFDVYFPLDYPSNPMHISFETTGNHRIRFNPNLYNDGKVCLSILNTWHGRPEEKWNSQTSSFLQVLVSIQSLILVPEPYFNEPGYERSRGTHSGTVNSREYDANIRQATVKWAMLEPLKNPCPCFKQVIERHFFLKKDEVLGQCDEWIRELETWSKEKRTMRSISHHLDSLRRHTTQLRDEIAKLSEDCLETPDDDTE